MALTAYNLDNISNIKKFNTAIATVLTSIEGRNKQLQQLLVIATVMAEKSDNFTWLTNLVNKAKSTKGINASRILEYIRDVLCDNGIKWNKKESRIKKAKKGLVINYNTNPDVAWYEYKKANDSVRSIDYKKQFVNVAKRAIEHNVNSLDLLVGMLEAGLTFEQLKTAMSSIDWQDNSEDKE